MLEGSAEAPESSPLVKGNHWAAWNHCGLHRTGICPELGLAAFTCTAVGRCTSGSGSCCSTESALDSWSTRSRVSSSRPSTAAAATSLPKAGHSLESPKQSTVSVSLQGALLENRNPALRRIAVHQLYHSLRN